MDVYAIVDGSQYPVIHVTMKKSEPSVESTSRFFEELDLVCKSNTGKFIIIAENRDGPTWMSEDVRKHMASRFQDFLNTYNGRHLASIFAFPNMVNRIILKGVNLFMKVHNTQIIVNTKEEAMERGKEILMEHGIEIR